jgi:hypothetical protein
MPPVVPAFTKTAPIHVPTPVVPASGVPKESHEMQEPEPLREGEEGDSDDDMEEVI